MTDVIETLESADQAIRTILALPALQDAEVSVGTAFVIVGAREKISKCIAALKAREQSK